MRFLCRGQNLQTTDSVLATHSGSSQVLVVRKAASDFGSRRKEDSTLVFLKVEAPKRIHYLIPTPDSQTQTLTINNES